LPIARANGQNVLFIHIPKTGGTSIEEWLRESYPLSLHNSRIGHALPCVPQHFHAELLLYLFDKGLIDYSFAVVRNPYRRLLSEYNYRMSYPRKRRERIFPRPSFRHWVNSTFHKFASDTYVLGNHIRPQKDFVLPDTEVFRFENGLEAVRAKVETVLGAPLVADIPVRKTSSPVAEEIDARTAAAIYEFYADDFHAFGYKKDSYR
jgi:hypothetical protein